MTRHYFSRILANLALTLVLLLPAAWPSEKAAATQAAMPAASPAASPADYLIAIGAGMDHSCALTFNGGVKCWGTNSKGQLGNGNWPNNSAVPVDVKNLSGATSLVLGWDHACVLTPQGGIKCWGQNAWGQLGTGMLDDEGRDTPVDVVGLTSGVKQIAAGGDHTCALTNGGGVKCWGDNTFGQVGDGTSGTSAYRLSPVDVVGLTSGVKAIGAGPANTCAVMEDGSMKCWGSNRRGQIGDGTWGDTILRPTPTTVTGLTGALAVSGGINHTCALMENGGVKCWGYNATGELGTGKTSSPMTHPVDVVGLPGVVSALDVGRNNTCALVSGAVWCWGDNEFGQVGDGTAAMRSAPTKVNGLNGVRAIATGRDHTCAALSSGSAYCWGLNDIGQLGNGGTNPSYTPVQVIQDGVAPQFIYTYLPSITANFK